MMNQTVSEQLALERLARKHERHLKFLRHSPRDQRGLPFAEQVDQHEFRDAVIGAAVFAAFVGALATMPWWLS